MPCGLSYIFQVCECLCHMICILSELTESPYTGRTPISHLKKTIAYIKRHTAKWTVGPMDFCVVGLVFTDVGRKRVYLCQCLPICLTKFVIRKLAICWGDPALTATKKFVLECLHDTCHRYPPGKHKKHIERKHQDRWKELREHDKLACNAHLWNRLRHQQLVSNQDSWYGRSWYPYIRIKWS